MVVITFPKREVRCIVCLDKGRTGERKEVEMHLSTPTMLG